MSSGSDDFLSMDPEPAGNEDNGKDTAGNKDNDQDTAGNKDNGQDTAGNKDNITEPGSSEHSSGSSKDGDTVEIQNTINTSRDQVTSGDELTGNGEDETTKKTPPGEDEPLIDRTGDGDRRSADEAAGTAAAGGSQVEAAVSETTPLVGDEGTEERRGESSAGSDHESAPPLPEKRRLSGSSDDVSGSGVDDQQDDDGDGDGTTQTERRSGPAQESSVTVPVTIEAPSGAATTAPNEPPPPYPGGPRPVPGRDPYDGSPGDDRIVLVQRTGNCPKCQVGNIIKNFSFCGICLAIWLFPCGLICLFCMRQEKCSHCGAKF